RDRRDGHDDEASSGRGFRRHGNPDRHESLLGPNLRESGCVSSDAQIRNECLTRRIGGPRGGGRTGSEGGQPAMSTTALEGCPTDSVGVWTGGVPAVECSESNLGRSTALTRQQFSPSNCETGGVLSSRSDGQQVSSCMIAPVKRQTSVRIWVGR